MQITELITHLAQQDIRLFLEDGALRFDAPEGAMTAELADKIRAHKQAVITFLQQQNEVQEIAVIERDKPDYPLSNVQTRFWLLQQINPESTVYQIQGNIALKGPLNKDKLLAAFDQLIANHEILHTQYHFIAGAPRQKIVNQWQQLERFYEADFSEAQWHQFLQSPLDLSEGLPIAIGLFKQSSEQHILSFKVHHIAADAISLSLLLKQLLMLYQGEIDSLGKPSLQYLDYALDELTADKKPSLDYWQRQLDGLPRLNLPSTLAFSVQQQQAHTLNYTVSTAVRNSLQQLASTQSTSLFTLLLSSFAITLAYFSRNKDFAIGIPVSLRQNSQLTEMMGCLINTLAIRFDLSTPTDFASLLQQTRSSLSDAFQHQTIAFEEVLSQLAWQHDDPYPVFNCLFNLQNASTESITLPELSVKPLEDPVKQAQYPIKMMITEGQNLSIALEYQSHYFESTLMQHMLDYFVNVIEQASNQPTLRIKDCFQLDAQDQLYLTNKQFNDTAFNHPESRIEVSFAQQVKQTPEALAIFDATTALSYRQLNQKSNQLAQAILAKTTYQSGVIALIQPRSLKLIISQLAILKAGFAYLPIPVDAPLERQETLIKQAKADLVITHTQIVFSQQSNILVLDTIDLTQFADTPPTPTQYNDLFNVIFTSGSTGTPKGVMVSHRAINNRLRWMQKAFPLEHSDRLIQKTPYHFDVSVWEFFWPLMVGAATYYPAEKTHLEPRKLIADIVAYQITHVHFVPSMLKHFIDQQPTMSHHLKTIFSSGEALSLNLMQQTQQQLPDTRLVNLYGPTEAAIDVSVYECNPNRKNNVPIGKPIDNIQLHVLDDELLPVPKGVIGELYIGGIGLAAGYINQPELTKAVFIDNPFPHHPSKKLYRTGDIVRLDAKDQLVYLGRNDSQIKIRGNRIELSEIEQQIMQLTNTHQAVVQFISPDTKAEPQLVAYVEAAKADGLKSELNKHLPSVMIPSIIMPIEEWPLSANGKVNKKALPKALFQRQQAVTPAETPTQKALLILWQKCLAVEPIGIDDHFFEIGGHSLKALELIGLIQQQFAIELPLHQVIENPTIRFCSRLIDDLVAAKTVLSSDKIDDEETFVI